jgi:hypothetical protein
MPIVSSNLIADLVVNRALWSVIQTVFPQFVATAPPETPLAEQQALQRNAVSTSTAPSNRSRLGRPTTGASSFVPPRPAAAAAAAAAAVPLPHFPIPRGRRETASTAPLQEEIDQLTEALDVLEVIDLTQENDDQIENNEPMLPAAASTGPAERSRQRAAAIVPPPHPPTRPLQQQPIRVLVPSTSSNWNSVPDEMPLAAIRPKRVVSGLFYRTAPSRQQDS